MSPLRGSERGERELVTQSGIVMLVRLLQPLKVQSPMLVTGLPAMVFGITSSPEAAILAIGDFDFCVSCGVRQVS